MSDIIEDKKSFDLRIEPYFAPSAQIAIKLAYYLAKYGHRAQFRKEMVDGKPLRYFEHVRRTALIMMDVMKIFDKDLIISCLLHDSIEDTQDLTPELLEHCFGTEVVTMVKLVSKCPAEGYHDRLLNCNNWKALAVKACDRLDNLRSLEATDIEFQRKQIKETKEHYLDIFSKLINIAPDQYFINVSYAHREIKEIVNKYNYLHNL
jgi:GTP pyrophosphokinase